MRWLSHGAQVWLLREELRGLGFRWQRSSLIHTDSDNTKRPAQMSPRPHTHTARDGNNPARETGPLTGGRVQKYPEAGSQASQ